MFQPHFKVQVSYQSTIKIDSLPTKCFWVKSIVQSSGINHKKPQRETGAKFGFDILLKRQWHMVFPFPLYHYMWPSGTHVSVPFADKRGATTWSLGEQDEAPSPLLPSPSTPLGPLLLSAGLVFRWTSLVCCLKLAP